MYFLHIVASLVAFFFFFQAEDGIRDLIVTGVQTCALPIWPTTVGLVPLGYGDGIPRHAGNRAFVGWSGDWAPVRGRICMDQFVVELRSGQPAQSGDEVIVFGPGDQGEPTAADWAAWCDTIGYEIVTRI